MNFTSKNAKAKPTESANSAKKTNADDIAKKATLKTAGRGERPLAAERSC